jgi:hypothetical protein
LIEHLASPTVFEAVGLGAKSASRLGTYFFRKWGRGGARSGSEPRPPPPTPWPTAAPGGAGREREGGAPSPCTALTESVTYCRKSQSLPARFGAPLLHVSPLASLQRPWSWRIIAMAVRGSARWPLSRPGHGHGHGPWARARCEMRICESTPFRIISHCISKPQTANRRPNPSASSIKYQMGYSALGTAPGRQTWYAPPALPPLSSPAYCQLKGSQDLIIFSRAQSEYQLGVALRGRCWPAKRGASCCRRLLLLVPLWSAPGGRRGGGFPFPLGAGSWSSGSPRSPLPGGHSGLPCLWGGFCLGLTTRGVCGSW